MLLQKSFAALAIAGLVAGCTSSGANYQPVVDGPVNANYNSDLAACQSLAAQQGTFDSTTGETALAGAAVGAGTMAVFNNKGTNVRDAALLGAAAGVASGALSQQQNKESIIRNCMIQRGHNVVG